MNRRHRLQFIRAMQHDRRKKHGDDFSGDAWIDRYTGEIRYTATGHSPNRGDPQLPQAEDRSEPAWRNTP